MSTRSDQLTPDRLSIDGYIRRHRSPLESTYSRLNTRDRPSTTLIPDNRSSGGPVEPRTAARVADSTGHGTPWTLRPSNARHSRMRRRSSRDAMRGCEVDECRTRSGDGPSYGFRRTTRRKCERARLGGRAHGRRDETVVQGMELPDVGVEIAGRRRQIGVAQPEGDGVHRIAGLEFS